MTEAEIQATRDQIIELEFELKTAKKNKKDVVSAHNDEIKRIQGEIDEKLKALQDERTA